LVMSAANRSHTCRMETFRLLGEHVEEHLETDTSLNLQ
jgi:hypothetical protein